ncbi:hypothetical protein KZZ52_58460 [Dactylosporangium sp. AC04546]|uniref:hypothetical protein n=1 Tax=Dactylosporangium sp. AC04546 TaxID=2862460 RepID=UPI001EDD9EDF|nr:hypothetical protein [Dactylosporangium sp. AC04546]WVK83582.1 hypothetical protein KZZ52_58460 [Dactylosporangium sp. AC04546]
MDYQTYEDYAPSHRLDKQPGKGWAPPEVRDAALRHALRGVDIGAYDERIIRWATRLWDDSTMRTLVSLIERARRAEVS